MADSAANKIVSDAAIVARYPELIDIVASLDSYAAAGRQVWITRLEVVEHGSILRCHLQENQLANLGYNIANQGMELRITIK